MANLERLHSLDAMRAAMMLLGLVLHSAVNYTVTPLGEAWPNQDPNTSLVFDWLVFFIHIFRMPAFFVMAGFFAAFLYYREGTRGFLAHRTRRLLLPLAAFWLVVFPVCRAGFYYAGLGGGRTGLRPAWQQLRDAPYGDASLAHLWFLYYLFIFCLAAVIIVPMVERLRSETRLRLLDRFAQWTPRVSGCLLLGGVTGLSLIPMQTPGLDTVITFLPSARVLIAYGVFFVFGWVLFLRREVVPTFASHPWRYVIAGTAASLVYLAVIISSVPGTGLPEPSLPVHLLAVIACGIATWLLIYGVTGLFVRYFERPGQRQRYLSDASYWMYLTHLPIVIWTAGAIRTLALPAELKFLIVLGVTAVLTIVTYHYLVRSTAVGVFLNGRRFARTLSPAEPFPARPSL